jgi:hypothetical protein
MSSLVPTEHLAAQFGAQHQAKRNGEDVARFLAVSRLSAFALALPKADAGSWQLFGSL